MDRIFPTLMNIAFFVILVVCCMQMPGCMKDSTLKSKLIENYDKGNDAVLSPAKQQLVDKYQKIAIPPITSGMYQSETITATKNLLKVKLTDTFYFDADKHTLNAKTHITVVGFVSDNDIDITNLADYNQVGSVLTYSNVKGDTHRLSPSIIEPIDDKNFYVVSECTEEIKRCDNGLLKIKYTKQ